jgi:release factor glutamine methyltransferase
MLPTPSTSHLTFSNIYEPSEDTFLFLDALSLPTLVSYHTSRFPASSPTPLIVETGTGSGVVIAFAAANATALFGRSDVLTVGTDVNHFACKGTVGTVSGAVAATRADSNANEDYAQMRGAGVWLDAINGSLTSCLRPRSVDVLLFNPPYVPSEEVPVPQPGDAAPTSLSKHDIFMRDSNCLALATDGGQDGMEITNELFEQLPTVISERGVAYVLLCAQNRPEEVKARVRAWEGGGRWEVETVHESGKQGGWEKLQIVRIARV